MKILYFDYDDLNNPYAAGGQAYTTRKLTQRLVNQHQITVVTGNYPNAVSQNVSGVNYLRLGIGNRGYLISILSFWLSIPLYVIFNQSRYDLILECLSAPFTASFVPLITKKPLIAVVHFFDSAQLAIKYHLPLDIFQKILIKKYTRFIVMTEYLQSRIQKLHPKAECTVIPGGVSDSLIKAVPETGKYVLYLGRIDLYNKGLNLLVSAWKQIKYPLFIAGSGKPAEIAALNKLISQNQLTRTIKLIGPVYGQDKINLYRHALFVVQPSLFETFGYVALESLAVGKLLVCFDIPGFQWIPSSLAIKIKSISDTDLYSGLLKAFNSSSPSAHFSQKAKNFAKKFNWDQIADQYQKVFLQ